MVLKSFKKLHARVDFAHDEAEFLELQVSLDPK